MSIKKNKRRNGSGIVKEIVTANRAPEGEEESSTLVNYLDLEDRHAVARDDVSIEEN